MSETKHRTIGSIEETMQDHNIDPKYAQQIHTKGALIFTESGEEVTGDFIASSVPLNPAEIAYSVDEDYVTFDGIRVTTWTVDDEYNDKTGKYDQCTTYIQIKLDEVPFGE